MTKDGEFVVSNVIRANNDIELSSLGGSSNSSHGSSITLNVPHHEHNENETHTAGPDSAATANHQDNLGDDLEALEPRKTRVTTTALRILEHILSIQNIILAIPTSILAIIGYKYLKWTAWKDFREDCRETLALTNQPLSEACIKALSGPYMPSPLRGRNLLWPKSGYYRIRDDSRTNANKDDSSFEPDETGKGIRRQADSQIMYGYDASSFLEDLAELEHLAYLDGDDDNDNDDDEYNSDSSHAKDELEVQLDPETSYPYKYNYTTITGLCSTARNPIPGPLVYYTPENKNCFYRIIPRTFESFNTATCPACEVGNVIRCQEWWRTSQHQQQNGRVAHYEYDTNPAHPWLVDSMNILVGIVLLVWVGPMVGRWFWRKRDGGDNDSRESDVRFRDIVLTTLTVQVLAHAAIMAGTGEQLI